MRTFSYNGSSTFDFFKDKDLKISILQDLLETSERKNKVLKITNK